MGKLKDFALNLTCKYVLKPNRQAKLLSDVRWIDCTQRDITVLLSTSNNVLRVNLGGKTVFFRECKRHSEIHQYVADEIEYYYTKLHPELYDDRLHIEKALADKSNFKRFVNMGITNDASSGAYHFCIGDGAQFVGLGEMPLDMETRMKDFVQFIWGNLFAYRLNGGVKIGEYQTYNAVRSIATYRLARLLGIGDIVPKTEYANLCIDNEVVLFGTVMDEAEGVSVDVECRSEPDADVVFLNLSTACLTDLINKLGVP